jgi:ATP synthase F1 complex assembly factor 2
MQKKNLTLHNILSHTTQLFKSNSSFFLNHSKFHFSSLSSLNIPMRLKKNFYKNVELMEVKNPNFDKAMTDNQISQKHLAYPTLKKFTTGSELKEHYYYILLDNKKCKTMYLDEYVIPNKFLAIALAKEWAKQKEYVNLYSMHLNFYASSGIRIAKDEGLRTEIINELSNYIETDQLCYLENKIVDFIDKEENERIHELVEKIFNFMAFNYEINLRKSESILLTHHKHEHEHENLEKIKHVLNQFDPWVLAVLEQITGTTKSICVSLALLENLIIPKQAYLISHSEEYYQMKRNGEVEGHHDIANELVMGKLYSGVSFHKMLFI